MDAYRHLLFATDLSAASDVAARRAADLARRCGARLTLLHVIDHFPEDVPTIPLESEDPLEHLRGDAGARLAELALRAGCLEAVQEVVVSQRGAAHEIAHYAEQADVDLLVLCAHHHHFLPELFGSTQAGVLHRVSRDLLLVACG